MNEHTKAERTGEYVSEGKPNSYVYPCGCVISLAAWIDGGVNVKPSFTYCPLHAAAGKLLEACKGFMKFVPPLVAGGETSPFVVQVRAAITEAEPNTDERTD